ncbi:hypothetical protein NLX86_18710 [Streptomyces sp. A3M-1-3]|nr:hypothetical protein [Streptomyces sp. A3M-1-3]MCP3820049.1 hypothetical protein [Streptomyces sp. A3M-1-3]
MPEQHPPRPVARRIDPAAGDTASMVELGLIEAEYEGLFVEPDWPPDEPE